MVNIETHSLYFSCIYPQFDRLLWLNYACPCHPIYRVSRYGQVAFLQEICRLLTLSVLYLQGSDAGQKYFKI